MLFYQLNRVPSEMSQLSLTKTEVDSQQRMFPAATNQQVVQGKSATNQQIVQGKSAPNQQTVQGNGVAPNVDFTCFSIETELAKVKIPIPLKELAKNPSYQQSISKFMGCPVDEANLNDEIPEIFLGTSRREKNHMPFFMSLQINGLILRNCMLDSSASTNILTLEVMNQFCLLACPQRHMVMDVVIIDCPTQWGVRV
jgi:hypothetical protein